MGKVGRPKYRTAVKFVEFKNPNGTVRVFLYINKKIIQLLPNNIDAILFLHGVRNPYRIVTNPVTRRREFVSSNANPNASNENASLNDDQNQINLDQPENDLEILNDSASDTPFTPFFSDLDEINDESAMDLKDEKSEMSPDSFNSNEPYNPFQILF
ncbi:hypothetical protein M9Y10_004212 [Tritrichomonas musculus]|uniref:Uncharacterized protein n=1 Tax=Tritrichomonas musculus TaxID=1915356 RepID=A0ABR2JRS3_9EUKA